MPVFMHSKSLLRKILHAKDFKTTWDSKKLSAPKKLKCHLSLSFNMTRLIRLQYDGLIISNIPTYFYLFHQMEEGMLGRDTPAIGKLALLNGLPTELASVKAFWIYNWYDLFVIDYPTHFNNNMLLLRFLNFKFFKNNFKKAD